MTATRVDVGGYECTAINSTIQRLLDQALTALTGTASAASSTAIEKLKSGAA